MKYLVIIFLVSSFYGVKCFSECDLNFEDTEITSEFEVLDVKNAKVLCGFDQDDNVITGRSVYAQIAGCELKLRDKKTKKIHNSYAGSVGCRFKTNETHKLKIHVTCCGREEHVNCIIKDSRKPVRVTNYDMPPDDKSWFCAGSSDSYVTSAVKDN